MNAPTTTAMTKIFIGVELNIMLVFILDGENAMMHAQRQTMIMV